MQYQFSFSYEAANRSRPSVPVRFGGSGATRFIVLQMGEMIRKKSSGQRTARSWRLILQLYLLLCGESPGLKALQISALSGG